MPCDRKGLVCAVTSLIAGIVLLSGMAARVFAATPGDGAEAPQDSIAPLALPTQAETMTDVEIVTDGINAFALDLYAQVGAQNGNVLVSPYSISAALAMTAAGARGETAQQMAKVLHVYFVPPAPKGEPVAKDAHAAFAQLDASLKATNDPAGCRLDVANALWGQAAEGFLQEFLDLTAKHYGAGLREVWKKVIGEWLARRS